MIIRHSIDSHEVREVVLVWCVVPVPCYHIKWRMILETKEKK